MRAKKASPEGKLAPQATEGELRAKRQDYPFGYNRSNLNFRIPLQSLRDSFPPGDAFLAHGCSVLSSVVGAFLTK